MAFTYTPGSLDTLSLVRLLIPDTNSLRPVFTDDEINAFIYINGQVWQSSQFYSGPAGVATLGTPPISLLRIAALALDVIASNKAKLSAITQLLDVKLSPALAAKAIREQAEAYRAIDDDSGAFAIIEQCSTDFAVRDRFWAQIQRQVAP